MRGGKLGVSANMGDGGLMWKVCKVQKMKGLNLGERVLSGSLDLRVWWEREMTDYGKSVNKINGGGLWSVFSDQLREHENGIEIMHWKSGKVCEGNDTKRRGTKTTWNLFHTVDLSLSALAQNEVTAGTRSKQEK